MDDDDVLVALLCDPCLSCEEATREAAALSGVRAGDFVNADTDVADE